MTTSTKVSDEALMEEALTALLNLQRDAGAMAQIALRDAVYYDEAYELSQSLIEGHPSWLVIQSLAERLGI